MVRVKDRISNDVKEVEAVNIVRDALLKAGYNPEEYLVIRNGKIIPDNEKINENDTLEIIKVVSGG